MYPVYLHASATNWSQMNWLQLQELRSLHSYELTLPELSVLPAALSSSMRDHQYYYTYSSTFTFVNNNTMHSSLLICLMRIYHGKWFNHFNSNARSTATQAERTVMNIKLYLLSNYNFMSPIAFT